ncbi:LysB family phage lysis regulatory protein [Enterobacteriaceae bacterium 89]|nr:LysB family phage lysis regulatory protein [Enterobacteriaceae bacterium 89]
MRLLAALLLAATLALLVMGKQNSSLRQSLQQTSQLAGEQKQLISQLDARLRALGDQLQQNDKAQAEWRQKLNAATQAAIQHEQTIARLLNENAEFRRWYSTALPDAVRRVHQRPACTSAGRCLPALSDDRAVPDASQRSKN